ncbi:MAG TPA: hypothetical protein VK590_03195 [Saprospiraceae bacterium]|nr:hypothetical protein [Saprospiraceae bacterium]
MKKEFSVGEFVCLYQLGKSPRLVEIIDEEYIKEIDQHDYYVRFTDGTIFGPFDGFNFIKVMPPNDVLKELL